MLFPELKQRRDTAIRANAVQAELDKPLTMEHAMFKTFGDDVKDYELEHYFANDVPGTFMKSANIGFNEKTGQFHHKADGRIVTKREFERAAPLYQNVILSKTDYVKKAEDELRHAQTTGNNAKVVEIKKLLDDPKKKFHLGTYDAQEKALLDQKARLSQLPPGVVDLTHIDDSIARIQRKREEILSELDFQRKLKIAGVKSKKEAGVLTDKNIGDWRLEINKRVREDYQARMVDGQLTIPVQQNAQGQYVSPTGLPLENLSAEQLELLQHQGDLFGKTTEIPMTPAQIDAGIRSETNKKLIQHMEELGYLSTTGLGIPGRRKGQKIETVSTASYRSIARKAGAEKEVNIEPKKEPVSTEGISLKEREKGPKAVGFKKIQTQKVKQKAAAKTARIKELEKTLETETNPVRQGIAKDELSDLVGKKTADRKIKRARKTLLKIHDTIKTAQERKEKADFENLKKRLKEKEEAAEAKAKRARKALWEIRNIIKKSKEDKAKAELKALKEKMNNPVYRQMKEAEVETLRGGKKFYYNPK
jgi:hypothetical protein